MAVSDTQEALAFEGALAPQEMQKAMPKDLLNGQAKTSGVTNAVWEKFAIWQKGKLDPSKKISPSGFQIPKYLEETSFS